MAGHDEHRRGEASGAVPPGALSALLQELAACPAADDGAWDAGLRSGAVVGRFELVRELGRGGFGVVWEARDRELGRRVAFKAVRAGDRRDLREERLLREAEAAARLSHPNIVTLHDVGRSEHGPYLVLELLEGETLARRLSRGALPVREAVHVAAEVAKGLAHAHGHGVIHRDLKPENVFLCADGQVKLLDLGLAHAFGQRRLEGGTPSYMAPEQVEGAPEDERTDVFALGVILFEMLAGKRPFESEKALRSAGRPPAVEVPRAPALGEIVSRMLEKEAVRRPRDGGDVASALSALERELEGAASSASGPVRTRRRRGLPFAAFVALAIAVLAVVTALALRSSDPAVPAGTDGRVVVAVADFENETGERELDALSGLLITSLEQSRRLSVLPRGRLFDLAREAGHGDVARIDEVLGREVGRRAGVRALLLATIHRLGGSYAVELRALDPSRDEHLFTVKEAVPAKEAIFGLIDRLAERARAELRESAAEARASGTKPAGVVATSLEAYEHYFRGQELDDRLRTEEAAAEYRKALEEDPRFALAHYALSVDMRTLGAPQEQRRAHVEAAFRDAERLPEKERLLVQAWRARSRWEFDEMRQRYRTLLERYPHDKRSLVLAGDGDIYCFFDAASARTLAERALSLDPSFLPARELLVQGLLNEGRLQEALDSAREWARLHPSPDASTWLAEAHLNRGEPDEALRAIGSAARTGGDPGKPDGLGSYRALVHVMRDELARAEAELEALPPSRQDRLSIGLRAAVAMYRGRPRDAERIRTASAGNERLRSGVLRSRMEELAGGGPSPALRAATREFRAYTENVDELVAIVLALAGEIDLADEVARHNGRASRAFVEAMRLRASGDLLAARRALEPLRREPPIFRRQAVAFALGETCHLMGDDRCAVEALGELRWLDDLGWGWYARAWAYPRSLLLVARSQERLGERRQARQTLDRLLALWKDAEPDFAPLAEAKELRNRLVTSSAARSPAVPRASVAVLPFADLSPEKDQAYLSDGIAEEILGALSRVEGLRVAGRTSSFYFKGRSADLRAIGARLRVASVLEGSVRRAGDRIRVSARLVDVAGGYEVWSESYDRAVGDVFAVQDEIAGAVASGLRVQLLGGARAGGSSRRTTRPEAYAELLRGRHLARNLNEADMRRAIQALERAVALDPGYAPAHAALSAALRELPSTIESDRHRATALPERDDAVARARAAAERAIALAPDLPDGYAARAAIRAFADFDWTGARQDLERAVALDPRDPGARSAHAFMLAVLGRLDEAIAATRAILDEDPLATLQAWSLGAYYNATGRHALARAVLAPALELAPRHLRVLRELCFTEILEGHAAAALALSERSSTWWVRKTVEALAYHDLGRDAESRRAIAELEARGDRLAYQVAQTYAWRGEADRAFEWLQRARDVRDEGLLNVKYDPLLRGLRGDPRYAAFLRRMNLPVN